MIKYVFRDDVPLRIKNAKLADPQKIGEALAEIDARCGHRFKSKDVTEAARDPSSPLHIHYEWDVQKAAEHHWDSTSRRLMGLIRVYKPDTPEPPPAFISVADDGGVAYRSLKTVQQSPDLQERAIAAAERDLVAFQRRYQTFKDVCAVVEKARKMLEVKRTKPSGSPREQKVKSSEINASV